MFDYDAVIVGAGPAGLTAGLYLTRAGWRTLVLEKESFGGYVKNIEWIENYPGFSEGVSGAVLASEMVTQAQRYGLSLEQDEVTEIELFSKTRWVGCFTGKGYTTAVVILAGGCRQKKLGVPGEALLTGKGVFGCALCEGDQFSNRVVAVCGGGDAGATEALYMAKLASKVYLIESESSLTAGRLLQKRVKENPKVEILCNAMLTEIAGRNAVETVRYQMGREKKRGELNVDGVLVHVGLEPNTVFLQGMVRLDDESRVYVNPNMETQSPYVFAAGDIRSGSPGQIVTAVGDGAIAAVSVQRTLQHMDTD